MTTFKLIYFNLKARGETTRMLFKLADQTFEDVRLNYDEWIKTKPNTPFNQLPLMECEGQTICQSRAIERFVAKRLGLYGDTDLQQAKADMFVGCLEDINKTIADIYFSSEDKPDQKKKFEEETSTVYMNNLDKMINSNGYVNGDKVSWPDIACFNILTFPKISNILSKEIDKHNNLKTLLGNVENNPKIASWIAVRPKTDF